MNLSLLVVAALVAALVGAKCLSPSPAQAGSADGYAGCLPVRVVVPDPKNADQLLTGMAFPSGATELRTVDHLIGAKAPNLPVYLSHDGTTDGVTAKRLPVKSRNSYVDVITVDATSLGKTFSPCAISDDPPPLQTPVNVLSFSATQDSLVHSWSATITEYRESPQVFSEHAMVLTYAKPDLEIVTGALVMAGDRLVGIIDDAQAPNVAVLARDIEPSLGLPGIARVSLDHASGTVTYEGLEFQPQEQASGYLVARVKSEARAQYEKSLGNAKNNALFIRAIEERPMTDLPGLLALLARCPAAPAPACAPTDAWGAYLSDGDATSQLGLALVAMARLRFLVDVQVKTTLETKGLWKETSEKLAELAGKLQLLDAVPASGRGDAGFKDQARTALDYWKTQMAPALDDGIFFQLKQALPGSASDIAAWGAAIRLKLQRLGTAR